MRLRERRRIEKRARIASRQWREFAEMGPDELLRIVADPTPDWYRRGEALHVLGIKKTPVCLLEQFFTQNEKDEIWITALVLEHAGGPDVIEPLIGALHDPNPHRRHAAARALGWNRHSGPRGAKALTAALADATQPQPVREEACESLAYLNWRQAIPALIAATKEPDVRIRFWATFGLGGLRRNRESGDIDPRVIAPLEDLLNDPEVAPGNWWSVGKEALSMLANSIPKYRQLEEQEKERILSDPNASESDRRWANPNWQISA